MQDILNAFFNSGPMPAKVADEDTRKLAKALSSRTDLEVYLPSITAAGGGILFLGNRRGQKHVGVLSPGSAPVCEVDWPAQRLDFENRDLLLKTARAESDSAAWLRKTLPYLSPRPLGTRLAAGTGDRLGLATAGHVRSIRKTRMAPLFAQQSVRENERTGRSPQQVLDDAMFGTFQEGWQEGFGADADHLKSIADVNSFVAAGYSFFTVDPGALVDNSAATATGSALDNKLQALPWKELESTPGALEDALTRKAIDLGEFRTRFASVDILRAAAKYGQAIAHTVRLYRHLVTASNGRPFDFEMSVDETDSPTTLAEHVYIASELRRLGVHWVSLAPRFVGAFEKGVDFIGDLAAFETSFAQHVAVARTFGPYKMSLHSGSDKFSVYPIAARLAGERVHLKTAGTSYLEALRAVAKFNPSLFSDILRFAIERYPTDRATYHVSAEIARIAVVQEPDALLDDFHARQVLHVTYGSVLHHERLREPFFETLRAHEEDYTRIVETHFDKHLQLFEHA
jgi:hypothetical protein